ncbi:MAG: hypothetical protein L0H19_06600 [Salinisphaera sp.]|nr:hypothetical protein [Salinisphaera sp.]
MKEPKATPSCAITTACACHEDRLCLGNGWLGANSRNATMKTLNALAATAWYYRQLIQIATGTPLRPELSARRALLEHFFYESRAGLARRRTLRKEGFARQANAAPELVE